MRSAPRAMAWSRNALNLISALHSTSGLGVRPARYSARKVAKTRSLYSAAKFTASMSMPIFSAAETASTRSSRVEQYSSSSSSSQFFMKRPTTSWPSRLSISAATAESTPPDIPTTTFMDSFYAGVQKQKAEPKLRLSWPWKAPEELLLRGFFLGLFFLRLGGLLRLVGGRSGGAGGGGGRSGRGGTALGRVVFLRVGLLLLGVLLAFFLRLFFLGLRLVGRRGGGARGAGRGSGRSAGTLRRGGLG